MSARSKSKANVIVKLQKLSIGLRQYLSGQVLTLAGKKLTVEELLQDIDGYVAQLNSADAAHVAWILEVEAARAMASGKINPEISALENYLRSLYGTSSEALNNFGLAPRKVRPRPIKEMAESIDKAAATRVARHTLGPRQKAKIHGVVAVEPTPPPAVASAEVPKRGA
jgi:hypothetical protein